MIGKHCFADNGIGEAYWCKTCDTTHTTLCPRNKIKISIYADYMSSGVWMPDGCNADPNELGISPGLQLALKYWHEMWEFTMADFENPFPSDLEFLQADLATVTKLLTELNDEDVMGRIGLQARYEELQRTIAETSSEEPKRIVSEEYVERWKADSRELAKLMSAENSKYEFVGLK